MGIDLCRLILFHPVMKRLTGSRVIRALAVCAGLTLAACSNPVDRIVGKWASGNDIIVTFTKEGKVIRQEGATTDEMDYSIQGGTNLYLKVKDAPTSMQFNIAFPSDQEMVLTLVPRKDVITPPQAIEPVRFTRVEE
jgi:hypothetical protein